MIILYYIILYIILYICICIYVYMYICIYVYMYICIYVYMYICMYIYIYIYIGPPFFGPEATLSPYNAIPKTLDAPTPPNPRP